MFSEALDCQAAANAFSFFPSPNFNSYGNNFHYNIFQNNFLTNLNSNLMKRMYFLRISMLQLAKKSMVALVLVIGVSSAASAQSFVSESEATQILETKVQTIQNANAALNSPTAEEAVPADYRVNQVKLVLFQNVLTRLNNGTSTTDAIKLGVQDNLGKGKPVDLKTAQDNLIDILSE